MYRIACKFEPNHPKIAGRTTRRRTAAGTVGHVERRGVWRVAGCFVPRRKKSSIYASLGLLFMTSTRQLRVGTLCNPRRILSEYQDARRLAQAVNRVGSAGTFTGDQSTRPQTIVHCQVHGVPHPSGQPCPYCLPVLTDVVRP